MNLNNNIFIFLWCCLLYLLFLGGDRKREASTFFNLRASSPFGGVARSHASATRERRHDCKRSTLSRLSSLATRNRELARAQANFLRFKRQRSRVVSRGTRNAAVPGSSSALSSATLVTFPKPTTEACFLRSACRRFQCSRRLEPFRKPEPLIFKHWSVSWPPTHLLVQLPATILDQVFKGGLNLFNSVLVTAFFSRKDLTDFYHFCLSEECWSLIKCYLSYKNIWDIGIISSLIFAKKKM